MDDERKTFEQMQSTLLRFVDLVNASHEGGVDFGTTHPLYPAEIHTIVAIGEKEGLGVTQLAHCLGVSKPTVSERVHRLVKKGVVRKEKMPDNAKAVTLWLTAEGRTAWGNHEALHKRMFDCFRSYFGNAFMEKAVFFTKAFSEALEYIEQSRDAGK